MFFKIVAVSVKKACLLSLTISSLSILSGRLEASASQKVIASSPFSLKSPGAIPILDVGSKVVDDVQFVGNSRTGFSAFGKKYHVQTSTQKALSQGKVAPRTRFTNAHHIFSPPKHLFSSKAGTGVYFVTPQFLKANVFPVHRLKRHQLTKLQNISREGFDMWEDLPKLIKLNNDVYIGIDGMTRRYALGNGLIPVKIGSAKDLWDFKIALQALITSQRLFNLAPLEAIFSRRVSALKTQLDRDFLSKKFYLTSLISVDSSQYRKTAQQLKKLKRAVNDFEQSLKQKAVPIGKIKPDEDAITLKKIVKLKQEVENPQAYEELSLSLSSKNFYPKVQGGTKRAFEVFSTFVSSQTTNPILHLSSQGKKSSAHTKLYQMIFSDQEAAYKKIDQIEPSKLGSRTISKWSEIPGVPTLKRACTQCGSYELDWLYHFRLANIRTLILEKYADHGIRLPLKPDSGTWVAGKQFYQGIDKRIAAAKNIKKSQ